MCAPLLTCLSLRPDPRTPRPSIIASASSLSLVPIRHSSPLPQIRDLIYRFNTNISIVNQQCPYSCTPANHELAAALPWLSTTEAKDLGPAERDDEHHGHGRPPCSAAMTTVNMMRSYMLKRAPNADFAHAVSLPLPWGCGALRFFVVRSQDCDLGILGGTKRRGMGDGRKKMWGGEDRRGRQQERG